MDDGADNDTDINEQKTIRHMHLGLSIDVELEYFLKGFVIALLIIAVFTLTFFVPIFLFNYILMFIVGPYLAGFYGGKRTDHGQLLGFLVGLVWSSIEIIIIINLVQMAAPWGTVTIGRLEMAFIFMVYFFNSVFCALGGRVSNQD